MYPVKWLKAQDKVFLVGMLFLNVHSSGLGAVPHFGWTRENQTGTKRKSVWMVQICSALQRSSFLTF